MKWFVAARPSRPLCAKAVALLDGWWQDGRHSDTQGLVRRGMVGFSRIYHALRRRIYRSGRPGGLPIERDPSLIVPFRFAPAERPALRIGAVIHLYYAEMAAEFGALLTALGPAARLMITTDTADKRAAILADLAAWGDRVEVRLVPNRGRDIAPKLLGFPDRYGAFDVLLFLHSKKSEYGVVGAGWRELLLGSLCGSDRVVTSILTLFAARSDVGLVFPQHHEPARYFTGWEFNFAKARRVARRMGVRLRRGPLEFPSGSMFWARPQALRPLLDAGLTLADFPAEGGQMDATTAHAIERLFALSAELAGYRWYKVAAPAHYRDRRAMVTVASAADLAKQLDRVPIRLIETMTRRQGPSGFY